MFFQQKGQPLLGVIYELSFFHENYISCDLVLFVLSYMILSSYKLLILKSVAMDLGEEGGTVGLSLSNEKVRELKICLAIQYLQRVALLEQMKDHDA